MTLGDRIHRTRATPDARHPRREAADPLSEYRNRVRDNLFARMGPDGVDATLDENQLHLMVVTELEELLETEGAPLSAAERTRIASEISRDILGLGPIEPFLHDARVTEIMVNGTDPIFVEREGRLHKTRARFSDQDHLRRVIDRIVARVGRRIDEASPMVDARLPDGSRVNAVIPPLSVDGAALTVRKFSADPYQVTDLIEMGTLTQAVADLLAACVEGRLNILITGGTGTGKTTLLNVMSGFIPTDHRIVTIEDAVELQLRQEHVVRLEYRPPNIEGRGEVTIRDLVRNSLRMRPDRIIVGEVRGGEALDMLQAMNTGHEGSMSTLHANTPRDGLNRLETMVMMAGTELPVKAVREYISSALTMVVHLARLADGSRRITAISEIVGMEGDIITIQDTFKLKQDGSGTPELLPTGIRPMFSDRLRDAGITLPTGIFGATGKR